MPCGATTPFHVSIAYLTHPWTRPLVTYGCSLHYLRLQPPLHTVAASITHGCSLHYIRLQPALLRPGQGHAALPRVRLRERALRGLQRRAGCLHYIRLQPSLHTVAASVTHGNSLFDTRLQPPLHTVTASITYGYSLHYIWPRQLDVAAAASVEEALRGFVAWEKMEGPDSWCYSLGSTDP